MPGVVWLNEAFDGVAGRTSRPRHRSSKERTRMAEDEKPKFRYQDVPDLGETFADTVGNWSFDGNTLRIEFLVSRIDPEKPSGAPTGRAVPVCRLVLTTPGAVQMLRTCAQFTAAL